MTTKSALSSPPRGNLTALATRLGALRQENGLTLGELAEAAGLDKGYLSRLERGLKTPSISTVMRLSQALSVPVAELLGERLAEQAVHITRTGTRQLVTPPTATSHGFELLTRDGQALESFVVHPALEFATDGLVPEHPGEELFFVLTGMIELRFSDRAFVLEAGDCAQFPGSLPHQARRIGDAPASALVTVARVHVRVRRKPS